MFVRNYSGVGQPFHWLDGRVVSVSETSRQPYEADDRVDVKVFGTEESEAWGLRRGECRVVAIELALGELVGSSGIRVGDRVRVGFTESGRFVDLDYAGAPRVRG